MGLLTKCPKHPSRVSDHINFKCQKEPQTPLKGPPTPLKGALLGRLLGSLPETFLCELGSDVEAMLLNWLYPRYSRYSRPSYFRQPEATILYSSCIQYDPLLKDQELGALIVMADAVTRLPPQRARQGPGPSSPQ